MFSLIFIVLMAFISWVKGEPVHCFKAFCYDSYQQTHSGCATRNFPPRPNLSRSCPRDATFQPLTYQDEILLLDLHNEYRNIVASGGLPPFQRASRMSKINWDYQLAYIAAINVASCQFEHDDCRNTRNSKALGQNLHMVVNSRFIDNQSMIRRALARWFIEHQWTSTSDANRCCDLSSRFQKIGHFTQMMVESAAHMGCSIIRYTNSQNVKITTLTCEYSKAQIYGRPIYKSTQQSAGSGCIYGRDSEYRALCAYDEY